MTSGSFEKFEEKLEREDYIQSIIRELQINDQSK